MWNIWVICLWWYLRIISLSVYLMPGLYASRVFFCGGILYCYQHFRNFVALSITGGIRGNLDFVFGMVNFSYWLFICQSRWMLIRIIDWLDCDKNKRNLPFHIIHFHATLGTLLEYILHLSAVIAGYYYVRVENRNNKILFNSMCAIVVSIASFYIDDLILKLIFK